MKRDTVVVHAGHEPDELTGATTPPIYTSSNFALSDINKGKGYGYSRSANPTRDRLEQSIAILEQAKHGLAFSSGMAAISAVSSLVKKDENIILCNDVYGGTYKLFTKHLPRYGITITPVDATQIEGIERHITNKTSMIWLETPTNPLMKILDIEAIAKVGKTHGLTVAVDNTFASPYIQNPLSLGASVVVHSTTKFMSGHGDVIGGAVATSDEEMFEQLKFFQKTAGAIPGPFDCYLTLRGLR